MIGKLFYYDETSPSCLRWAVNRGRVKIGDVAGSLNNNGYWVVNTGGKGYCVHRIIMHILEGFPLNSPDEVDHINRNRSLNKRCNLRVVSKSVNMKNIGLMKSNKSGVAGVHWCASQNKWRADISHNNRSINLGYYDTLIDAVAARIRGIRTYGGTHAFR